MNSKSLILVLLVVILGSSPGLGQERKDTLKYDDQDFWETVAVPNAFNLYWENVDVLLSGAKEISHEEATPFFRQLTWKPGARLFKILGRSRYLHVANLGEKTCPVSRRTIGYFLERIDSELKAMELAMYFHDGVIFTKTTDFEAMIQACTVSNVATVTNTPAAFLTPISHFDAPSGMYRVSFIIHEDRKISEVRYLITADGFMGYSTLVIVEGPPEIEGWTTPDEVFRNYVSSVQSFEMAIQSPLESAAVSLLGDAHLSSAGLSRARESALEWLLDNSDVERHTASIREFLDSEGSLMGQSLRVKALSKLRSIGEDLSQEEIRMLEVSEMERR